MQDGFNKKVQIHTKYFLFLPNLKKNFIYK